MTVIRKIKFNVVLCLITLISSCVALYFSFTHNYILTYNDAASHMNIARRIIDNLTPGFAQIGTVWLPLPHVLMIPFVFNDYLWHTGLAGSIVSMAAYIITVLFTYKLIFLITEKPIGATIGALVMALNPNLLYLQTTPMTEPLLLAIEMLSFYFIAKFLKTNAINDLILSGAFAALSTLTRYDGWFIFLCVGFLLPIWLYKLRGRKEAESSTILFLFSGGFGIFLWFLWNQVIFGSALYFLSGPYSAQAQQQILKQVGQLPTQGNIWNSLYYYFWSMVDNNGLLIILASFVGFILLPFLLKTKRYFLVILAVLSPIVFNILALYFGQSAMNVPQAPHNPGMFNIRYGMMALPAIAVLLGIIASNKYLRYLVVLIITAQSFLFVQQGIPVSLADGIHGLEQTYYTVEASKWLKAHYQGGLILTSLASHDAFVARTQLPMKLYVHEGTRQYWYSALKTPSKSVEYIATLSFPPDFVYRAIYNNSDFLHNFVLVHNYGKFGIYKRK